LNMANQNKRMISHLFFGGACHLVNSQHNSQRIMIDVYMM
jgi:hypothetical protein